MTCGCSRRAPQGLGGVLWLLLAGTLVHAQSSGTSPSASTAQYDAILAAEGYQRPPAVIERVVTAPRHLQVNLSAADLNAPEGSAFLRSVSEGMPRLADLARFHYDLAGWQVDPVANRSRDLTVRADRAIELIDATNGTRRAVQLPRGARVGQARWSPDGKKLAFFVHTPTATHLYVADAKSGRSRQITPRPVLATHVTTCFWTADSRHVITVLVPRNRGPEPAAEVPTTPKVRVAIEGEAQLRTYFSLLETPTDMARVEYYSTGQLARIDVRTRRVEEIGKPTMIRALDPSPDGRYFRVTRLVKPFSYHVPLTMFGVVEDLWDEQGRPLVRLMRRELAASVRNDPVTARAGGEGEEPLPTGPPGRRALAWRPEGPGFTFLQRWPPAPENESPRSPRQNESQDPPRQAAPTSTPRKDRVVHWLPPFTDDSIEVVYEQENEIQSVHYSEDGQILFLTEQLREGNRTVTHLFAVDRRDPTRRYTITRSPAEGSLETMRGSRGQTVVRLSADRQCVYLTGIRRGTGEGSGGRRFLDRLEFRTGKRTILYESDPAFTESSPILLDRAVTGIVVQRQSRQHVPQYFYRNLVAGEERQITHNPDLMIHEWRRVTQRTVYAKRADGATLRVQLTLPPDFREGDRRPAMFWIYPREYESVAAYERTWRGSPRGDGDRRPDDPGDPTPGGTGDGELLQAPTGDSTAASGPGTYPTLPAPSSITLLALVGYVVVQPDIPIIGPRGRMNDRYVEELRSSLAAVIDQLDRDGIIDRNRLAVGGHSYGGFSTANALVHTTFFRAGIAGAGNYNRTLTPMGFQNERRTLWSARDTYLQMSPFLYANQLNGALLLYHGMRDSNVGTHPINSERMFHALDGLGKQVALYMYPYESHGQIALESRLDLWARWIAWLEKYVRHAPPSAP